MAISSLFMFSVWYWLLLDRERYWSYSLRKSSNQYHSKLILVPYHKPLDTLMDLYNGQTFELKTRVDIWMRMYVITVE